MQREALLQRFLGYVCVQFSILLVPLLTFQLTRAVGLAGLSLAVEMLPKVFAYLFGGAVVARLGSAWSHLALEGVRLGAMSVFLLCAQGYGALWMLGVAAAAFQCANAVSSVLFERLVPRHWASSEQGYGFAMMLRKDQLACLPVLGVGLLGLSASVLCAVALCLQVLCVWRVMDPLKRRPALHAPKDQTASESAFWPSLRADLSLLRRSALWRFLATATCLGLPFGLVFSVPAHVLANAGVEKAGIVQCLSLLMAVRVALSVTVLTGLRSVLQQPEGAWRTAVVGVLTCLGGGCALLWAPHVAWTVGAMGLIGLGMYLYQPQMRVVRQALVARLVPPSRQVGATSVLSAVEVLPHVVVAVLLGAAGHQMEWLYLAVSVMAATGAWFMLPPVRPAEEPDTRSAEL